VTGVFIDEDFIIYPGQKKESKDNEGSYNEPSTQDNHKLDGRIILGKIHIRRSSMALRYALARMSVLRDEEP
jgi:hypothetical protein